MVQKDGIRRKERIERVDRIHGIDRVERIETIYRIDRIQLYFRPRSFWPAFVSIGARPHLRSPQNLDRYGTQYIQYRQRYGRQYRYARQNIDSIARIYRIETIESLDGMGRQDQLGQLTFRPIAYVRSLRLRVYEAPSRAPGRLWEAVVSAPKSQYTRAPTGRFPYLVSADRFGNAVDKRRQYRTFCDISPAPLKRR